MHEQALMRGLVRRILEIADAEGATRVTRVRVQLGPLSHFTPDHFREHYVDATNGTIAAGAVVDARLGEEPTANTASDVVLLELDVEVPDVPR
ncbi:MAG TPA: hydrogenase maturation nickel metallochaperone HypA [Gaiellaceae bacterium]|nr:hydrogenase maturation nickel metallochaperone HypA [Gaiellaceae bacterium]